MGHRVIGVDVEGGMLRAAVVETRLRRFEIRSVVEVPIEARVDEPRWATPRLSDRVEASEDEATVTLHAEEAGGQASRPASDYRIPDLLERALGEPLAPTDSVAVVYPGVQAFVRRLSFPFKDASRIAATLPYQMLGQVPVQPDEVHCAFERTGTEAGKTDVVAVAVPKAAFREWLAEVRSHGVEPAHVGVDGVCLAALLPYVPPRDDGAPVMLIRTGEDQVELVVARGTRVEMVRVVALGEPVIASPRPPRLPTPHIVSPHRSDSDAPYREEAEVSPALMREVLVTAAGASEAGLSVGAVLVTGRSAHALVKPFQEVLGVPCEVLDPANLALPGGEGCPGLAPEAARVVALALGAASASGPGSLNLLTGEFQKEGAYGLFRERFRLFAVALVVFAVLGAARFAGRVMGLHAEREAVLAEVRVLSAQVLGEAQDDHAAVLKTLRAASEEDIQVFPRWTAVDVLGRLIGAVRAMGASVSGGGEEQEGSEEEASEGVPRKPRGGGRLGPEETAAVEIETVRIEPRAMSVRGEADTIETLDGLVEKLKADPCFHEVTTESTERIQFRRHQGWQRFSLRMEVDCGQTRKEAASPGAAASGAQASKAEGGRR